MADAEEQLDNIYETLKDDKTRTKSFVDSQLNTYVQT